MHEVPQTQATPTATYHITYEVWCFTRFATRPAPKPKAIETTHHVIPAINIQPSPRMPAFADHSGELLQFLDDRQGLTYLNFEKKLVAANAA